ncbi:MAG: endonuclease III [Bacteroidales bacterium]|nr:endonuclease III [Bacteroidales bacterium]
MTTKERYKKVIEYFQEHMPVAETELHYASPYELIVAVMLSAQCTDKRVNMITPAFFRRFPDPVSLADAGVEEILEYIKSCSYPNSKARHLSGMAKKVVLDFGGEVPSDRGDLMSLPGVGRKSANVISLVAFGRPAMPVDTHVFRVSARLGLTNHAKNPYAAEVQLVRHIPEPLLALAHHWLILHGRYICIARKPKCDVCGLSGICRYFNSKGR